MEYLQMKNKLVPSALTPPQQRFKQSLLNRTAVNVRFDAPKVNTVFQY